VRGREGAGVVNAFAEGTLAYARLCTTQARDALQIALAMPDRVRRDEVEKALFCLEDALRAHANAVRLEDMTDTREAAE
jgi:hypothetical protein